jgi:nucleotide-binding universal stress UspA family protein
MSDRWVIGLNLSTEELGPLELGAWLHEAMAARLTAVHVAVTPALPRRLAAELEEALQRVLERQIAEAGHVVVSDVRHGRSVAGELIERAAALDAGLLVGRCAPRSSAALVRLGRTARRVLRRAPGVVGIAPPELKQADIGAGPVLLAIDPHSGTAASIDFARSLAEPHRATRVATASPPPLPRDG